MAINLKRSAVILVLLFSTSLLASLPQGLYQYTGRQWSLSTGQDLRGDDVAVIVHGWTDSLDSFKSMAQFLAPRYSGRVFGFQYGKTTDGIEESAAKFKAAILKLAKQNRVHVFAHSMGGLVTRYAVEQLQLGQYIHHVALIGTPERGIPLIGYLLEPNEFVKRLKEVGIEKIETPFGTMRVDLAKNFLPLLYAGVPSLQSLMQMSDIENGFLARLNGGESAYAADLHYVSIQGNNADAEFPTHIQLLKPIIALFYEMLGMSHDGVIPVNDSKNSCLAHKARNWSGYISLGHLGHNEMRRHSDLFDVLAETIDAWRSRPKHEL